MSSPLRGTLLYCLALATFVRSRLFVVRDARLILYQQEGHANWCRTPGDRESKMNLTRGQNIPRHEERTKGSFMKILDILFWSSNHLLFTHLVPHWPAADFGETGSRIHHRDVRLVR